MSESQEQYRQRICERKTTYITRCDAESFLKDTNQHRHMRAYKCDCCSGYHVATIKDCVIDDHMRVNRRLKDEIHGLRKIVRRLQEENIDLEIKLGDSE